MSSLRQQFIKIKNSCHGLITPISSGRIWELSLPKVLETEFTQTSLVLEKRPHLYYLHDNGSCNNGIVFHLNSHDRYVKSMLMMKYHVRFINHEYYGISFSRDQSDGIVKNVHNLTQFLLKLNQLFRIKL